jgi:hypothetical protein
VVYSSTLLSSLLGFIVSDAAANLVGLGLPPGSGLDAEGVETDMGRLQG